MTTSRSISGDGEGEVNSDFAGESSGWSTYRSYDNYDYTLSGIPSGYASDIDIRNRTWGGWESDNEYGFSDGDSWAEVYTTAPRFHSSSLFGSELGREDPGLYQGSPLMAANYSLPAVTGTQTEHGGWYVVTSRAGIVPLDVDMSVLHTVNGGSRQSIDAVMALKQPLANPPNLYAFPFYGYTDVPAHGQPLNIDNASPGFFLGGGRLGELGSPWTLGNVMGLGASAQMGRNNLLRRGLSQPFHWRLGIGAGVAAGIARDLVNSATGGGTKHIPTLGGMDPAASVVNDDNVKSTDTDDNGNLTGIAYADGTAQAWTYDPTWNQVTSYTNQAGQLITQAIDPDSGLVLAITEVVGAEDARSAETDDLTTLFAYTDESDAPLPVGLLRSVTDPEGQVTRIDYDDDPASDSFALANALTYAYGTNDATTTLFGYDAAGNVNSLTDAMGNTTAWVYTNDRVTEETVTIDGTDYTRSYQYDAEDRLEQSTDRNGRVIEYLFDDQRGERVERWFDGATPVREIVFDYDDATGLLISVDDTEVDFTYTYQGARLESAAWDFADFEVSAGQPDVTFTYGYQGSEHVATRVTLGSTGDYQTAYAYDAFGRLVRVEQTSQPGGNAVSPKGVDFTYTPDGLPETITRYADADGDITTSGTKTVASSAYTYDPSLRRLTDLIHAQGATTLAAYAWTYDDTGRIDLFGTPEGTYDYQYDATGQLVDVSLDAGGGFTDTEHYEYDDAGNRTTTGLPGAEVTYATGDANRMTDAGNYSYTHDPEGNTTARFIDVDTDGALSTGDTNVTEYEWDHRNRLTRVISRDTEGGAATQEVQYTYDYLNRWVAHTVDLDGDGAGAATSEYFVYDATSVPLSPWERAGVRAEEIGQIVLQLDDSGAPTHRYLWGQAVDQILADEIVDDGGAEDVLWTLTDHQNTVRDLAVYDDILDQTSVVNHIAYDSFGNVTSETNAAVDHLFGYTGRAFDETTGLQNNLHRWYDAAVGRWLSEDPIGFEANDANLYRYVGNSSVNAADPSGLKWFDDGDWYDWINPFAYAGTTGDWLGDMMGTGYVAAFGGGLKTTLEIQRTRQIRAVEEISRPNSQMTTSEFAEERLDILQDGLNESGKTAREVVQGAAATVALGAEVGLTVYGGVAAVGRGAARRGAASARGAARGSANRARRTFADILSDNALFKRWVKRHHPKNQPLSPTQSRQVWDKLRQIGKKPKHHPAHSSGEWTVPHIHVDGRHIPVDPGFIP